MTTQRFWNAVKDNPTGAGLAALLLGYAVYCILAAL
jgi:hypothetical protein